MRGQTNKQIARILLLPALFSAVVLAGPAAVKIKISKETALFRLEPDPAGAVAQEQIVMGTEFDAERKNGERYEVNLRSKFGACLPAYVHESDAKPAVRSTPPRAAAENGIGAPSGKSLVLSLGGGPVFPPTWGATITSNRWLKPYEVLQSLAESNTMTLSLKPPIGAGFGLGLTYFFSPRLGIQFRIDIMSNRAIVDGLNEYTMTWKWLVSPNNYSLDPPPTWPISGYLRAQPVSLGLLARLLPGSRLQPYLQAGIAYFLCRFKAESQIGFAQTWVEGSYQSVDYFTLPVSIDEFFNGLGFMGGAGLEWLLGSKTAVFVQADYFAGPTGEVGWAVEPGTYSAHFSSTTLSVDENNASMIRKNIPPFTVNVGSLFRLLAGIKIIL